MNQKYLSPEIRKELEILENTDDINIMATICGRRLAENSSMQVLWEYRKWFKIIEESEILDVEGFRPTISAQYMLVCDFERAMELVRPYSEESFFYRVIENVLPCNTDQEYLESLKWFDSHGISAFSGIMPTMGKPTVYNGMRDYSGFAKDPEKYAELKQLVLTNAGGCERNIVVDVMEAERLYLSGDSFKALVKILALIPIIREKKDARTLFVALALQMRIMAFNGEVASASPMMDGLRQQMKKDGSPEFIPNLLAMEAWTNMQMGRHAEVAHWIEEEAPNEFGEYCILDSYQYVMKLRGYIMEDKPMLAASLASGMLKMLEICLRPMDICETETLFAISEFRRGDHESAFGHLSRALEIAEDRDVERIVADEGTAILPVLDAYRKARRAGTTDCCGGTMDYLMKIRKEAAQVADIFPHYLEGASGAHEKLALSTAELKVLKDLAAGKNNGEIAEDLCISVNTVKFHLKNVFKKLGATNRREAVNEAVARGLVKK